MGSGADALRRAVGRAYQVFDVPAPRELGVCTYCCLDPKLERAMLRKSPEDLTLHEVQEWLAAADREDLSYPHVAWILPRILDLLAEGHEVALVGNALALRRLSNVGFPNDFSAEAVKAVKDVCHGLLARHVELCLRELDELLCMFERGSIPLAPFLATLDAMPDEQLANLLYRNFFTHHRDGHRIPDIWYSPFWDGKKDSDLVWQWYTSASMKGRMVSLGLAGNERAEAVFDLLDTYGPKRPLS